MFYLRNNLNTFIKILFINIIFKIVQKDFIIIIIYT
jgi:hypothetical protein